MGAAPVARSGAGSRARVAVEGRVVPPSSVTVTMVMFMAVVVSTA